MKITMKKMLAELNKDLEWEYSAAIQYTQHAATINGAEYDSIQKELLLHAQEEMQHAVMLSEQINSLGGVPTVDVEKRENSGNNKEMLSRYTRPEVPAQ